MDWTTQFRWNFYFYKLCRLCSHVIYKFTCTGCNACYIGETTRHSCAHVRVQHVLDKALHVYKHLQSSGTCCDSCSAESFTAVDSATASFQVKRLFLRNKVACLIRQQNFCVACILGSSQHQGSEDKRAMPSEKPNA